MPRKNVKTSYRPVKSTPSQRTAPRVHTVPMNKPKPRTEILHFVETNRVVPTKTVKRPECETLALIEVFQKDVCTHDDKPTEIAHSPEKRIVQCPNCKRITTVGAKAR